MKPAEELHRRYPDADEKLLAESIMEKGIWQSGKGMSEDALETFSGKFFGKIFEQK